MDMRVMLNEIRSRYARSDAAWSAHVAQAERLCERQDRFGLATLYDHIAAGFVPWTPASDEDLRK